MLSGGWWTMVLLTGRRPGPRAGLLGRRQVHHDACCWSQRRPCWPRSGGVRCRAGRWAELGGRRLRTAASFAPGPAACARPAGGHLCRSACSRLIPGLGRSKQGFRCLRWSQPGQGQARSAGTGGGGGRGCALLAVPALGTLSGLDPAGVCPGACQAHAAHRGGRSRRSQTPAVPRVWSAVALTAPCAFPPLPQLGGAEGPAGVRSDGLLTK